jgi:para-aminobenzoate synthetase
MRCLLIDNYDSFSWILADCIGQVFGEPALVLRNDQLSWDEILAQLDFDCIVISPGPGSAAHPADLNVARQAVLQSRIPVLGVCLGFQGIAHLHGARIAQAAGPFHGRASHIHHQQVGLFAGIPTPFRAIRYHSLIVVPPLPVDLLATAQSDDGVLMALEHRTLPQWGVQFHPESVLTEHGLQLLANFRDLARPWLTARSVNVTAPRSEMAAVMPTTTLHVWAHEVATAASAQAVFEELFAREPHCFWLDSQLALDGMAGLSFMGAVAAHEVLTYRLQDDASGEVGCKLLHELDRELADTALVEHASLPFDFRGGFVGYLSYEMKGLFGAARGHANPAPDLLWMRVQRFIAIDPLRGTCWIVAVARESEQAAAHAWIDTIAARLDAIAVPRAVPEHAAAAVPKLDIAMDFSGEEYLAAIAHCQRAIVAGESYEICLTNRFTLPVRLDPWELYVEMRTGNPAPFGAFLKSGTHAVLSTSPERFLRVDRAGEIQAKPIKGTAPRADSAALDASNARMLASSLKERAENLMIVDLMRSDLSRVALPGSVRVPVLMDVESYQTVHQLVSTVVAQLRPECSLVDLLRATFPGGSISGAPKLRTLQIIDQLERSARGVYCGAVGYVGYGRVADLSIAIRTVAYDGSTLRFGAGGAITYLSEPEAELREMLLKADAVLRPIWQYLTSATHYNLNYTAQLATLRLEPMTATTTEI